MVEPFPPNFFRRLQQLKIHTRRAFLGSRQGMHKSLRRGHGLEFADFRLYTPGDDFRHIDWSTYGKTDRLYVRQFSEEQDLNVVVMLDTSASMGFPEGERKFETARELALALGYVALTDGDCVVFSLLGQLNSQKYRGPKALSKAAKQMLSCSPSEAGKKDGGFDLCKEVRAAVATQKIPGRCFLISDFLFGSQTQYDAIDVLRARNFDVTVIQVLAPSELSLDFGSDNLLVMDAETQRTVELELGKGSKREYAELLAHHIAELEAYCRKTSIVHVLVSSDESVADIVLSRLPALGLLK